MKPLTKSADELMGAVQERVTVLQQGAESFVQHELAQRRARWLRHLLWLAVVIVSIGLLCARLEAPTWATVVLLALGVGELEVIRMALHRREQDRARAQRQRLAGHFAHVLFPEGQG